MALDPERRLGGDLKQTEQVLMSAKAAALRDLDLTVAQYAALLTLSIHPGISGSALARACLVTPQAAAAVLKTLTARGLVERTSDDWNRNVRPSRLTADGATLLAEADERASAIEQRVHDALTAQERETLRRLLRTCREAVPE
ncbi:MarR family transcriptional regulator [Enemella evansiae]|uniref:MarR family winged helix-turn-helix transcriptional regulator n=1 Tax=Enemella evansiae TaxID=2016499 RepID=UPI000B9601DE|nr:MarR family transcriptional regulator [Enemella evansiae]OYN97172.1 MarR family transcriptional regulator [Enemella evansiae]OYO13024.1 MarR family transcriptional regulator [Enemella evansiae]